MIGPAMYAVLPCYIQEGRSKFVQKQPSSVKSRKPLSDGLN